MKKIFAIAASVLLLSSCEAFFGGAKINNDGSTTTTTIGNQASTSSASTISTKVTANLIGAKAVVSSQSTVARSFGRSMEGRGTGSSSVLSMILDDGSMSGILNVPTGVVLPEVQFLKISPVDLSVFVLFASPVVIDPTTSFSFVMLDATKADASIEIIETTNEFAKIATDGWAERQDPLVFTDDGSIYYVTKTATGSALKGFANHMASVITPTIPMTVSRFFTDGVRVFYLGKNSSDQSVSLKMYNPVTAKTETVFSSTLETWIKDCFIQDGNLVLSGYNIPDPEVQTRSYSGILQLAYDSSSGKFNWKQIYGNASDSANAGWAANRRQLKATYFSKADGTVNSTLLQGTLAPFFTGGLVPDTLKPFSVVDIDKVVLDATLIPTGVTAKLEHKFWFGLLSGQSGFDSDYFYKVFMSLGNPDLNYYDPSSLLASKKVAIPTIVYPFTGSATLEVWMFDLLFGSGATSAYSYSGTTDAYLAAMKTATASYFSTLALKTGADPRVGQFDDNATDLTTFKAWLDKNFTYTWVTGNAVFNASTSSVKWQNTLGYTPLANVYYAMQNAYGSPVQNLSFKSAILGSAATAAQARVLSIVNKFYPLATLNTGIDVNLGVNVSATWSNSDANKVLALKQVFTLGSPRVDSTMASWVAGGLSKFYEYSTNHGIVDDPYFKKDLSTLFDTFNNLDRFTLTADGSLYATFRKLNGTGTKVVKLMNGATGDITGAVVYDDIKTTTVKLLDHYAYYSTRNVATDLSTMARVDFTLDTPVPEIIVDETSGITAQDFDIAEIGGVVNLVFTAVDPKTSKAKVGKWNSNSKRTDLNEWKDDKPSDSAVAVVGKAKKK